jgi:hypothetical protein
MSADRSRSVVAGVLIGNRGVSLAMSDTTQRYLLGFWTLIDEILNSVLFLLIGLEVLVLQFTASVVPLALAAIPIVLFARLCAVAIPVLALRVRTHFEEKAIVILTWAGVRGGISIALALSIGDAPTGPRSSPPPIPSPSSRSWFKASVWVGSSTDSAFIARRRSRETWNILYRCVVDYESSEKINATQTVT